MTFSSPLRQRITACIAILAVLLLFVAPMVSKTLQTQQSRTNAQSDSMTMSYVAMPQHAGMAHDAMAPMSESAHHAMMMDGMMPDMAHNTRSDSVMACGYCDLLIHVPLMVWVFIPFIWLTLIIARAPPVPGITPPLVRHETYTHPPRAPPTFAC